MGYLRIKCHECGESWPVKPQDIHNDHRRVCPWCCKEIDRQTWNRFIVPAFGEMEDASRELVKDHTGYPGVALFTISYFSGSTAKELDLMKAAEEAAEVFQRQADEATAMMEKDIPDLVGTDLPGGSW